jgi:hypothetical protein
MPRWNVVPFTCFPENKESPVMNLRSWSLAGGMLVLGLLVANTALADKAVAPRRAEPAKVVLPVQVKQADLAGEGDGVKAKLVLPARLRETPAGKKVGAIDAPRNRSLFAALALSLAAVSVVLVLRGKNLRNSTKAAILGIATLIGVGGIALANVPPPPEVFRPKPAPAPAVKSSIVIEYSADVEEAILTIGK